MPTLFSQGATKEPQEEMKKIKQVKRVVKDLPPDTKRGWFGPKICDKIDPDHTLMIKVETAMESLE
jgi:hypothetical protein